jgi:hypothetical protein
VAIDAALAVPFPGMILARTRRVAAMENWTALVWTMLVTDGIVAIYGLHRLALRMEDRGWIYYLNKKPRGSAMGSFVALQKVIEPRAEHVLRVSHVNHVIGEEGVPGNEPAAEGSGGRLGLHD